MQFSIQSSCSQRRQEHITQSNPVCSATSSSYAWKHMQHLLMSTSATCSRWFSLDWGSWSLTLSESVFAFSSSRLLLDWGSEASVDGWFCIRPFIFAEPLLVPFFLALAFLAFSSAFFALSKVFLLSSSSRWCFLLSLFSFSPSLLLLLASSAPFPPLEPCFCH